MKAKRLASKIAEHAFCLIVLLFVNASTKAQWWGITGNSGLSGTANFVGTTDGVNFNLLTNTSAGGAISGDIVFRPTGTERARFKAGGQFRIGPNATNNAIFETDGDLSFTGTADYIVNNNRYVFRADFDQDLGLNLNTTSSLFEFKDASALTLATLNYSTGVTNFRQAVIISAEVSTLSPYTTQFFVKNHYVDAFSRSRGSIFVTGGYSSGGTDYDLVADDIIALENDCGTGGDTYGLTMVGLRNDIENATSNVNAITYGIQSVTYAQNGTLYGLYCSVTGANTKYAGYFIGAQSYFSTNVGIGTTTPAHLLQLGSDDACKPSTSTWSICSDRRLKEDIHDFTDGWDVLKNINPVWFTYNGKGGMPKGETAIGTIAQDLQKAAPYMVHDCSCADPDGSENYLNVNYHALFFILTNTVKEQHQQIESLETTNGNLKQSVDDLKAQINELSQKFDLLAQSSGINIEEKNVSDNSDELPSLVQNAPNPFSQITTINYFLPKNISSAKIIMSSSNGKTVRVVNLSGTGSGQIFISAGELSPGVYQYSLIVDGNMVDTKSMEVTR